MAASILYRFQKRSPRKLLVLTIYKEGSHENRPEKVSVAIVGMVYDGDEKILQGGMIPRSRRYRFCIGNGYTEDFLGVAKLEEDVGGIEGLQGGMIPGKGWYGPGIGPGHSGGDWARENG